MRKTLTLMSLAVVVLLGARISAHARMQLRQSYRPAPHIVDFFDIAEMPLRIDEASATASGEAVTLAGSAVNRSSEPLVGCHFILLVVGQSGRVRQHYRWSERLAVGGVTIKEFTLSLPKMMKPRKGERLVLGIDSVVGRNKIWGAIKGEEALRAYAVGEEAEIPEVREMENYVDGAPH